MKAFVRRHSFALAAAASALVGGACFVVGCDDDDPTVTTVVTGPDGAVILGDDALGDDDDASEPYTGPTQGGTVIPPAADGSLGVAPVLQDGGSGVVDTACCNVTFVYDPSHFVVAHAGFDAGDASDSGDGGDAGDASAPTPAPTAVSLVGDAYPLENGASLPMTKGTNGTWSVTACIPHGEYLRYRFDVGSTPNEPGNPDAGSTPDDLCDPTLPSVSDGFGSCYDTFGPVSMCSDVDASTGSLLGDP